MTTGKTLALTRWTFVGKVMCLLFNMGTYTMVKYKEGRKTHNCWTPLVDQSLFDILNLSLSVSLSSGSLREVVSAACPFPLQGSLHNCNGMQFLSLGSWDSADMKRALYWWELASREGVLWMAESSFITLWILQKLPSPSMKQTHAHLLP